MHQPVEVPVRISDSMSEQEKYETAWRLEEYRHHSPGKRLVDGFRSLCKPPQRAKILDIGCGTGKAGLALHKANMDVWLMDFAENCLDDDVFTTLGHRFICMDISEPWALGKEFDFGYCCDVMEHLPPHHVDLALWQMKRWCKTLFFSISLIHDSFGPRLGRPLHLTVKSYTWWIHKLSDFGTVQEARDLPFMGVYVVD